MKKPTAPRNLEGFPSWAGTPGDSQVWKEALDAYYWDEVIASYDLLQALGVGHLGGGLGTYRLVEGEALTRETSTYEKIDPHHTLELCESQESERPWVTTVALESIATVSSRLGWDFTKDTWIAVLSEEADVPWNGARAGYMMNKYPYDKICLPASSLGDPDRFAAVFRHEYSHVAILNRTHNRAPGWLQEGIAMTMQGLDPAAAAQAFRRGAVWQEPTRLDNIFTLDRRDEAHQTVIGAAYSQAQVLVGYLYQLKGDEGLRALLGSFTNNSIWTDIKIALGEPSAQEALDEVYGFGQRELFERARMA